MFGRLRKRWIERRAARWLALMEADTPSEADRARFEAWRNRNPAHARAYEELLLLWRASVKLTPLAELARPRTPGTPVVRRWMVTAAVLATFALVTLGLLLLLGPSRSPQTNGVYVTTIGETRHLRLPDASEVSLGPGSRLELAFSPGERRVLLGAGEAYFAVVPDAGRPFRVDADGTRIEVLGTRFNVHQGPHGFTIAVAEGTVEVARHVSPQKPGSPLARRRLGAGERVVAPSGGGLTEIQAVPVEELGAWREGRLVYEDAALAEVIADANRYFARPIEIADPDLAALRVIASFRVEGLDRFIADLEASLPLVADRSDPARIVLRPAPSDGR